MILMDANMPGMDGTEASRTIRSMNSKASRLPIIGLTGGTSEDERRARLEAGMNDIIYRPVGVDELHNQACEVLGI